jgi:3-hydroxyacyl-CoA dehydrogenase
MMTQEEGESLIGRVAYTTRVEDLDSVDAVVEAVTEDPRVKGTLFQQHGRKAGQGFYKY